MSFLALFVLLVGAVIAWWIGKYIPFSDDYRTRARRQHEVVAVAVWMTMFCTGWQQGQYAEFKHEQAIREYDDCAGDNEKIEGEIARRQRALDDARDKLEGLLEDPPGSLDDLPFDINSFQDPLVRDALNYFAATAENEYDVAVENTRADVDRLTAGIRSYRDDNPVKVCGSDPR